MGILSRIGKKLTDSMGPETRNQNILGIIERKGIKSEHYGMHPATDAYGFKASKAVLYGNGKEETINVNKVIYGIGDDYVTLILEDGGYREIPGFLMKDVEV